MKASKCRINLIGSVVLTAAIVSLMAGCSSQKVAPNPVTSSAIDSSVSSQDTSSEEVQTSSATGSNENDESSSAPVVSSKKSAASTLSAVPTEAKADTFSVKAINKSRTENGVQIQTSIPEFSGFTACNTLNSKVSKTISDEIQTQQKNVKELNSPNLKGLTYQCKYAYNTNGNILSVWLTVYENNAGVHGNTFVHSFNMNTKSGEFYNTPYSLFPNQSAAKSEIISDVIAQFKKTVPAGDLMNQAIQQIKDENGNFKFYIENKNLVICFDEYEIMPYAYGRPTFKLPLSGMKAKLANP